MSHILCILLIEATLDSDLSVTVRDVLTDLIVPKHATHGDEKQQSLTTHATISMIYFVFDTNSGILIFSNREVFTSQVGSTYESQAFSSSRAIESIYSGNAISRNKRTDSVS
ncbi:hypothetical protein ACHAXN_011859 [Cyclotella atomus]